VLVRNLADGSEYRESYDKLLLSPGAAPLRPPIPGADLPGVFALRNLDDADAITEAIVAGARHALVVGAGFIGLELAENLRQRGLETTLVELLDQVLPQWDREMTVPVAEQLVSNGVTLKLSAKAERIERAGERLKVSLSSGESIEADLVVFGVGVRPEVMLAKEADLELGQFGGIKVDSRMRTSDPDIYAVGDAVEVYDYVTGQPTWVALAGPASRQGRIAADNIFARDSQYRGTQGTAIVRVFDCTIASTGLTEKALRKLGQNYEKAYVHVFDHAGYYPGASRMCLKLLFHPSTGHILGAQAVGGNGVDKRIDVLAIALQGRMTVFDLEEAELAYAPQFGAAKDPVNMAGFVAAGAVRGDQVLVHADQLNELSAGGAMLLDVRMPAEVARGTIPGSVNIPLPELRGRINELPRDKKIVAFCQVGMRGYLATRILRQRGFDAANLSGGYATYSHVCGEYPG
jgi:NADPH-dependent 2,4-dienoyl-CoA reductase/sulfur reductase-like enzyme/rhodanese-related sulfurtransferase